MFNSIVQKEAFPLASLMYANVNAHNVSARLMNATNCDSFIPVESFDTSTRKRVFGEVSTRTRGGFIYTLEATDTSTRDSRHTCRKAFFWYIKKGSVVSSAHMLCDKKFQPSCESDFNLRRWRRFISTFAAVIKKPAVLSPSSFSFSISSKSSRGSLTEICKDRLFFLPVAIAGTSCLKWCSVYTAKLIIKHLRWCSLSCTLVVFTLPNVRNRTYIKRRNPGGALTPTGPLTTTPLSQ